MTLKRAPIRSTIFNITFIVVNLFLCILFSPCLLLPWRYYMIMIKIYHKITTWMEEHIMGIHAKIEGLEHLPKDGPYIVAAKHMSTYETFKLHVLFYGPAIILKRELLMVPLWGTYLWKSGVIAIDRSSPDKATSSIKNGALKVKDQGRPIIIYPQGTRVWPHETPKDKPYKTGVYRIQKATDLPVIPLATNSGLFWPRRGWLKSPGTVTFKFLPPIEAGKSKAELMTKLEHDLETESNALMDKVLKANE